MSYTIKSIVPALLGLSFVYDENDNEKIFHPVVGFALVEYSDVEGQYVEPLFLSVTGCIEVGQTDIGHDPDLKGAVLTAAQVRQQKDLAELAERRRECDSASENRALALGLLEKAGSNGLKKSELLDRLRGTRDKRYQTIVELAAIGAIVTYSSGSSNYVMLNPGDVATAAPDGTR